MNSTFATKQSKFNSGEVSPSLYGEVTNPKYPSAVKTCRNWLPVPQGPLVKRPGTRWINAVKDNTYAPRLVPFVFSDGRSFVLEIGNGYTRFVRTKQYVGADGNLHTVGDGYVGGNYELATPWSTAMLNFLTWAQTGNVISLCYGGQNSGTAAIAPQDLTHTTDANIPWAVGATPLKVTITSIPSAPTLFLAVWSSITSYNAGDMVLDANGGQWSSIFGPNLNRALPSPVTLNAGGTGVQGSIFWMPAIDTAHQAVTCSWVATAVVQDPNGITFETSQSAPVQYSGPLSSDRVVQLNLSATLSPALPAGWTLLYLRIYQAPSNGVYGWVADVDKATLLCRIEGRAPNYAIQPPKGLDPFIVNGVDSFPAVVGYLDQRRLWANTKLMPSTLFLSKAGDLYNYDSRNTPGADSDSLVLLLASDVLEEIRAFVPKRRGLILTQQGEWAVSGQGGGGISRTSQDAKKQSDWGSSWLRPLKIGTGILFNTAKANMVRDLYPLYGLYSDIWDGQDLTVLSRHLFELSTLVDWAFQATPYPFAWACRSDGTLLCLTYQHAPPSFGQQLTDGVVAWSRHDSPSSAVFERVAVVPEPPEDAPYFVVKRTVAGATVRWIERMDSPIPQASPYLAGVADVRYTCFLDASLLIDGHNTNAASLAVIDSVAVPGSTLPANYTTGKQVKVTVAVAGPFVVADAANPYGSGFVFDPENLIGNGVVKGRVVGFTSANVVTIELDSDMTQAQITAWRAGNANWGIAKGKVTAAHLAGVPIDSGTEVGARGVCCLVDGDPQLPADFTNGVASLATPGLVIQIGLSYNSDMEPLDAWSTTAEIRNKFKNLIRVGFEVANTRDLWVGKDSASLVQWQQRRVADEFGVIQPQTGYFEEFVFGEYNKTGAYFVRHFTPLPATIASILREMTLGDT